MSLTDDEQQAARARFRKIWERGVPFNRLCGMEVRRWDADGVEIALPLRDDLMSYPGVFHGGVISALIDTAAVGSVAAGHNFDYGERISTTALTVHYEAVDPGAGAVALGRTTRRSRQINFCEVVVNSDKGKEVARGLVHVVSS